jgi:copper homeostasis protein
MARKAGAAGVVLGLLTPCNTVDLPNTRRLAKQAAPLQITFHKAIDEMTDPAEGVKQLLEIEGITRILTSGGEPTALAGAKKLTEMIRIAKDKIIILAAGKVTRENVNDVARITGATELHGRRIVGVL